MAIGHQTEAPDGRAQQHDQDTAQQMQDKAQEAAQKAQQQAQQVAGQARDRIRGQFDQRSTHAGEQIAAQAGDIRTVAQQLREQGKDTPAQLADRAAQQTEQVASYLRDADADRMIGDAEAFARRRPWAVVAGGIALGFAMSRFLKASSSQRYQQSMPQRQMPTPPPMLPPPGATTVAPTPPASGIPTTAPIPSAPAAAPAGGYATGTAAGGDGDGDGRRSGTDW